MINREKISELLYDRKTFWEESDCFDGMPVFDEKYRDPMMEALGDDPDDIKTFLSECNDEDLDYMSEFFGDIYGKFMTEDMWEFLTALEVKLGLHD